MTMVMLLPSCLYELPCRPLVSPNLHYIFSSIWLNPFSTPSVAGWDAKPIQPIRIAKMIFTAKNPGSRNCGTAHSLGKVHPLKSEPARVKHPDFQIITLRMGRGLLR